jgi:hypothetical protein
MQQSFTPHSAMMKMSVSAEDCRNIRNDQAAPDSSSTRRQMLSSATSSSSFSLPKREVAKIVSGIGLVDRDAFADRFDMGVPLDATTAGNERVVLLYSTEKAFPTSMQIEANLTSTSGVTGNDGPIRYIGDVHEATENCDSLHVVLTSVDHGKKCVAIMGQYESYHIQKFMRLPEDGASGSKKVASHLPLRWVNRGSQLNGRKSTKTPTKEQTLAHWKNLVPYIDSLDSVLEELDPIANAVASHNDNNAVIVMVCNFGQSELLMNCKSYDVTSMCSRLVLVTSSICFGGLESNGLATRP